MVRIFSNLCGWEVQSQSEKSFGQRPVFKCKSFSNPLVNPSPCSHSLQSTGANSHAFLLPFQKCWEFSVSLQLPPSVSGLASFSHYLKNTTQRSLFLVPGSLLIAQSGLHSTPLAPAVSLMVSSLFLPAPFSPALTPSWCHVK